MAGAIAGWETGTGPALLFLHGGPGVNENSALFAPEAEGWRFITFQQGLAVVWPAAPYGGGNPAIVVRPVPHQLPSGNAGSR